MNIETFVNEEKKIEDSELIFGTVITWKWVEENLTDALGTKTRFGANKSVKKIGIGQGFLSQIGRLHPDWVDSDRKLPETFVIKLPSIETIKSMLSLPEFSEKMKEFAYSEEEFAEKFELAMQKAHNAEVGFYHWSQKLQVNASLAKVYVAKEFSNSLPQGVIIMEDMGENAHVISPIRSLSPSILNQAFDSIAAVHALSLTDEEWKKINTTNLSEFIETNKDKKLTLNFLWIISSLDEERIPPLLKELEEYFDDLFDPKLLCGICDEMGIVPVMVHGDLWCNNILWRSEGDDIKLAAIIDWQIIHDGCAVEDLVRLICCSLSVKDRRESWDAILKEYYEKLSTYLGHQPPFTFEKLKKSFLRIFPSSACMILPVFSQYLSSEAGSVEVTPEMSEILREKAVGLLEDILACYKLNKSTSNVS